MRILVFTDVPGAVSAKLLRALLRLADARADVEVCGIVTSRPERFRRERSRRTGRLVRRALVAATNPGKPLRTIFPPTLDLDHLERRRGLPVRVPRGGDPNDPSFVASLTRDLRPDVALSLECLSVFRRPLLDAFAQAVNYHAGLLPKYRGVMATSFSILAGEEVSGFTFHRMTERIDLGPILVQGAVPIFGSNSEDVGHRKLEASIDALPLVLDRLLSNDPGTVPDGIGSPFRVRDWAALIHVDNPEYATAAQLERRIRAFGTIQLTIGGRTYPVTRLRESRPGNPLAIETADGRVVAPDRFDGLPKSLYRFGAARSRG